MAAHDSVDLDDLWDPAPKGKPSPIVAKTLDPEEFAICEMKKEEILGHDVRVLHDVCVQLGYATEGAFYLSEFTPPEKKALWCDKIHPMLISSLTQIVKVRNDLVEGIGIFNHLAISVNQCAQLLQNHRASAESVKITQDILKKHHDALLNKIEECHSRSLELVRVFEENAPQILAIVGAEGVKQEFETIEKLEKEINTIYNQVDQLHAEHAHHVAEVEGCLYTLQAMNKYVQNREAATAELKADQERLQAMITEGEQRINNIPDEVTVTENGSSGSWFWKRRYSRTFKQRNPHRDADRNFLETTVAARRRVLDSRSAQQANQEEALMKFQTEEVKRVRARLGEAQDLLKASNEKLAEQLPEKMAAIAAKRCEQQQLKERLENVENAVGLKGNALYPCLKATRFFAKLMHGQGSIMAPFESMLRSFEATVSADLRMIQSQDSVAVLISTKSLLNMYHGLRSAHEECKLVVQDFVVPATSRLKLGTKTGVPMIEMPSEDEKE